MPVVLTDRESIITWLDTSSGEWSPQLSALLKPFAEPDGLECYKVTPEVGKVGRNSPDFIIPVEQKKGGLESFFAKQASSPKKTPIKPGQSSSPSGSKKRDAIVLDDEEDEAPTADPADAKLSKSKRLKTELNSA